MVSLTRKYLLHDKTRLAISVSGISLSLLLIFTLSSLYAGFYRQSTIYIDNSGADLWVVQRGAVNFFFSVSFLPLSLEQTIAQINGVQKVSPIITQGTNLKTDSMSQFIFYFGYDNNTSGLGAPWSLIQGTGVVSDNQIVVDRTIASNDHVAVGSKVGIDNATFTVVGISSGTNGIIAPYAFMSFQDAERISGYKSYANFFLVKLLPGTSVQTELQSVGRAIPTVDVATNSQWASSTRTAVLAGTLPILEAMVVMGGVTGTLTIGLTSYTATVERQREYGILKAIGIRNRTLFGTVFAQSIVIAVVGFLLGGSLSLVASSGLSLIVKSPLPIVFDILTVTSIFALAILIGIVAALLPVRKVAKVDPALAFK